MHKTFMVYDSKYTVVEPKVEVEKVKELPTVKQETEKKVDKKVKTEIKKAKENSIKKIEQKAVKKETTAPKILTEQEEEIQWNIWRSNLQNQIMKETRMPIIPQGTIFRFTFEVDKYGKISNVQTWSETPTYTPHAIQHIAPVIRSLQGRAILEFPEGSNRIQTTVKGGWKISSSARYSTPKDYNDTETIKK